MIVMLAAMLAAEGGSLLLDCTVPDRRGRPTSWSVNLDQPNGAVEVKLGGGPEVYKAAALYRPGSIMFDLLDASISINREDGVITRTLVGHGVREVVEGTCIAAKNGSKRTGSHTPATSLPAPEPRSGATTATRQM